MCGTDVHLVRITGVVNRGQTETERTTSLLEAFRTVSRARDNPLRTGTGRAPHDGSQASNDARGHYSDQLISTPLQIQQELALVLYLSRLLLLLCLTLTLSLPLSLCSDFLPEVTASQLNVVPERTTITVCACEIAHRRALR